MTNKEAKEKLYMEWQKFLENNIDYAGISEAYKMAFKALEQESKTEKVIKTCNATPEERESVDAYIKSISKPTGIEFDEEQEQLDFVQPHKSIPVMLTVKSGDTVSRKSIKHKLQEHYDFFVNAYGGFSNLSQNDKSRVDEISNCIAMVVNEPSVNPQPKIGHWIKENSVLRCSICDVGVARYNKYPYCPNCGAKMVEEQKSEDKRIRNENRI